MHTPHKCTYTYIHIYTQSNTRTHTHTEQNESLKENFISLWRSFHYIITFEKRNRELRNQVRLKTTIQQKQSWIALRRSQVIITNMVSEDIALGQVLLQFSFALSHARMRTWAPFLVADPVLIRAERVCLAYRVQPILQTCGFLLRFPLPLVDEGTQAWARGITCSFKQAVSGQQSKNSDLSSPDLEAYAFNVRSRLECGDGNKHPTSLIYV